MCTLEGVGGGLRRFEFYKFFILGSLPSFRGFPFLSGNYGNGIPLHNL